MEDLKTALDAISLYQAQYAQVDTIWGYFSVVTIAMVGFVISSEKTTRTMKEPAAIIIAYLVFCWGNYKALILGQEQLVELGVIARTLAGKADLVISSFQPISPEFIFKY
jgi:hypothetical protein